MGSLSWRAWDWPRAAPLPLISMTGMGKAASWLVAAAAAAEGAAGGCEQPKAKITRAGARRNKRLIRLRLCRVKLLRCLQLITSGRTAGRGRTMGAGERGALMTTAHTTTVSPI